MLISYNQARISLPLTAATATPAATLVSFSLLI